MNVLLKYVKKRRIIVLFASILLILGIIIGFMVAVNSKSSFIPILNQYKDNIKGLTLINLISHFSILAFLLITSIIIIGIPLYIITFFIEGLNVGFLITIFSLIFKIKGFLFSLLFIFFNNLFFLIFLFLLFPKCLEITRNIIGHFLYKKDNEEVILKLVMVGLISILIMFFGDFISFFISPKILKFFHFLLS